MFYCVNSIYRAGGNVSRSCYAVHSPIKPDDYELELPLITVVNKYFNDKDEAIAYLKSVQKSLGG